MKVGLITLVLTFTMTSPVFAMTCLNRDMNEILVDIKIDQAKKEVTYSETVYGLPRSWKMRVDVQPPGQQITQVTGPNGFLLKMMGQGGRDFKGQIGQRALLSGKGIPGSANEMVCR